MVVSPQSRMYGSDESAFVSHPVLLGEESNRRSEYVVCVPIQTEIRTIQAFRKITICESNEQQQR